MCALGPGYTTPVQNCDGMLRLQGQERTYVTYTYDFSSVSADNIVQIHIAHGPSPNSGTEEAFPLFKLYVLSNKDSKTLL